MTTLSDAKVGDTLRIRSRGLDRLERVIKITKTQVVTLHGHYRKANGKQIGLSDWNPTFARIATPEDVAEVQRSHRHAVLANRLCKLDWYKCPVDVLEKVFVLWEENQ